MHVPRAGCKMPLTRLDLKDLLVLSKPPHWQADSNTDRNSHWPQEK